MFDLPTLIGGSIFVLGNIALTFATMTYAHHLFSEKKTQKKDKLDPLKNALLTFALSLVYPNAIGDDYNYDKYDGNELPPLSGSDGVNALMSYIVDSPNPHIHSKYNAIQRFLQINLYNEEDQEDFLQNFLYILNHPDESDVAEEIDEPGEDTNKDKEE
jgi:hypothetical protein